MNRSSLNKDIKAYNKISGKTPIKGSSIKYEKLTKLSFITKSNKKLNVFISRENIKFDELKKASNNKINIKKKKTRFINKKFNLKNKKVKSLKNLKSSKNSKIKSVRNNNIFLNRFNNKKIKSLEEKINKFSLKSKMASEKYFRQFKKDTNLVGKSKKFIVRNVTRASYKAKKLNEQDNNSLISGLTTTISVIGRTYQISKYRKIKKLNRKKIKYNSKLLKFENKKNFEKFFEKDLKSKFKNKGNEKYDFLRVNDKKIKTKISTKVKLTTLKRKALKSYKEAYGLRFKDRLKNKFKRNNNNIGNMFKKILFSFIKLIGSVFISVFGLVPICILIILVILSATSSSQNRQFDYEQFSPEVLRYESMVLEELKKYGLEKELNTILAIIQVESGGLLPDVMQSSESAGLPVNSYTNPKDSIVQGVKAFNENYLLAKKLGVDEESVWQAYNFGSGFLNYVVKNGKKYSLELSESFSKSMSDGKKVKYNNPIAIKYNGGFRYAYGNFFYVENLKKYLIIPILTDGNIAMPTKSKYITSYYGYRDFLGVREFHTGIDIADAIESDIYTVLDGVVEFAEFQTNGYGNVILIDHGSGVKTLYAHLNSFRVQAGQKVKKGQIIAGMGTTGRSTGSHLHFEIRINNNRVDPYPYLFSGKNLNGK